MVYVAVGLICLVGATVQAATGFAFAIIVVAGLSLFLPYKMTLMLVVTLSVFQTSAVAFRHRRHINFKLLLWPLIMFLFVSYFSVKLVDITPDAFVKQILGGILILLSLYFLFFSKRVKIRANVATGLITGGVSGLLGGFFGMGGPPIVLYLIAATDDRLEYLGTIQFFFAVTNFTTMLMRLANGYWTPDIVWYIPAGAIGMIGGVFLGSYVFKRMSAQTMRTVVYVLMLLAGVWFAGGFEQWLLAR